MSSAQSTLWRSSAVGLMFALSFASAASAQQPRACQVIEAKLADINAHQARFSQTNLLRAIQRQNRELRRAERDFRSEGCDQTHVDAYLRPICNGIADIIDDMHDNLHVLKDQAADAKFVRREKRQLTRKASRLGCNVNSNVTIAKNRRLLPNPFTNRLGDVSNAQPRAPRAPDYTHLTPYQTVRTMCVRKSDGYYWPISFSTTKQFLNQDADLCRAQCPQADVALYFHKSVGEGVNNMVSLEGEKYQALDTAFLYRTKRDTTQCTPDPDNKIAAQLALNGVDDFVPPQPRQSISVSLPPLDPRLKPAQVANLGPQDANDRDIRTINSAGQTVRLVGPDTPYVQLAEESS